MPVLKIPETSTIVLSKALYGHAAHGINGRVDFEGRLGRLEIEDQKLSGPRRHQVIASGGMSFSGDIMSVL
ncbi:hypothetical protein [Pseudoxanthomonas sp. Root65]|uniref:hypothetical protein n=1 Tax=Pseudoxanthomonas sp. Root65 TaxID=1736576 RepID=UPI0012E33FAC|nr:hypothetical protein [Pseudoxanthomonas sp. Root65]